MVDETTTCLGERNLIVDVNPQLTIRGDQGQFKHEVQL